MSPCSCYNMSVICLDHSNIMNDISNIEIAVLLLYYFSNWLSVMLDVKHIDTDYNNNVMRTAQSSGSIKVD